jgi:hypothetical protein
MNFFKIVFAALTLTLITALIVALTPPPTPEEVAWEAYKREAYRICGDLSSFELRHHSMPRATLAENQRNCFLHLLKKKRRELKRRER